MSELNFKIELVGEVRDRIAQSEQDAASGLPLGLSRGVGEFVISDGTKAMPLIVEGPSMGEILDLAITFDAETPLLGQLTFQSPIDLKLKAINLNVIPDLSDEKGVDRRRVTPPDEFRHWPEYRRSFRVSSRVDADRITAEMRDGVITLVLPKVKEAKPRRIEVT